MKNIEINDPSPAHSKGFTIVELMVVISIIALMIALLLPALGKATAVSQQLVCMANLRSMGFCMVAYQNDNKLWVPPNAYSVFYKQGNSGKGPGGLLPRFGAASGQYFDAGWPDYFIGYNYTQAPMFNAIGDPNGATTTAQYYARGTSIFHCPSLRGQQPAYSNPGGMGSISPNNKASRVVSHYAFTLIGGINTSTGYDTSNRTIWSYTQSNATDGSSPVVPCNYSSYTNWYGPFNPETPAPLYFAGNPMNSLVMPPVSSAVVVGSHNIVPSKFAVAGDAAYDDTPANNCTGTYLTHCAVGVTYTGNNKNYVRHDGKPMLLWYDGHAGVVPTAVAYTLPLPFSLVQTDPSRAYFRPDVTP